MIARFGLLLVCVLPASASALAQSDEASVMGAVVSWQGVGFEVQARYHRGGPAGFSLGGGLRSTNQSGPGGSVAERSFFLEPRFVFGADSAALVPYAAGRFAILRRGAGDNASGGRALGAGGGVLLRVDRRLHLDISGGIAVVTFQATDLPFKADEARLTLRIGAAVRLG